MKSPDGSHPGSAPRESTSRPAPVARGLFQLGDDLAYQAWRDAKLSGAPRRAEDLIVPISDLGRPTHSEISKARAMVARTNMVVYRSPSQGGDVGTARAGLAALARCAGLTEFESHRSSGADGIVPIEVVDEGLRAGFIPFSNRPINWHTDGYYNYRGPERCIRAMALHCVRSASEGGESGLFDPDIAYIRLRDQNPDFIAALMHPEAMTIPAHEESTVSAHGAVTGPVFVVHPGTGALIMRFTIRKRNVIWRDDPVLEAALAALGEILARDPLVYRLRLEPGMGVLCNNVLHDRRGFENAATASAPEAGRLLFRIRSYNTVFADGSPSRH